LGGLKSSSGGNVGSRLGQKVWIKRFQISDKTREALGTHSAERSNKEGRKDL